MNRLWLWSNMEKNWIETNAFNYFVNRLRISFFNNTHTRKSWNGSRDAIRILMLPKTKRIQFTFQVVCTLSWNAICFLFNVFGITEAMTPSFCSTSAAILENDDLRHSMRREIFHLLSTSFSVHVSFNTSIYRSVAHHLSFFLRCGEIGV